MLPRQHRLRSSETFRQTVRSGRRGACATLVVHATGPSGAPEPALVGFVVGRAVGNAVVRNRMRRRLRHLTRDRIASLTPGQVLVIRALPPAVTTTYADLGADLDRCLRRTARRTQASMAGHPGRTGTDQL